MTSYFDQMNDINHRAVADESKIIHNSRVRMLRNFGITIGASGLAGIYGAFSPFLIGGITLAATAANWQVNKKIIKDETWKKKMTKTTLRLLGLGGFTVAAATLSVASFPVLATSFYGMAVASAISPEIYKKIKKKLN